jgi:protein TonB
MKEYRLHIAVALSAACHAAMLLPGWSYTPASAMPRRGDNAVTLELVESVEAVARPVPEPARPVAEVKREIQRKVETASEQLAAVIRRIETIKLPDPPTAPPAPAEPTPPQPVIEPILQATRIRLDRSAEELAQCAKAAAEAERQRQAELLANAAEPAPLPPAPKAPPEQTRPEGTAEVNSIASNGGSGTRGVSAGAQAVGSLCPIYPPICRRRGEEGKVVLEWQVLASGKCGQVRIVTSSGNDLLDQAAVDAVKNAAFRPAASAGRAVDSTMACTFRFTLTDQEILGSSSR